MLSRFRFVTEKCLVLIHRNHENKLKRALRYHVNSQSFNAGYIINMTNSHMANCCEGSPLVDGSFHVSKSLIAGVLYNLLIRR